MPLDQSVGTQYKQAPTAYQYESPIHGWVNRCDELISGEPIGCDPLEIGALAGSAGRAVWVGRGVDVGVWVAVGAIAVAVSFAPAVAVSWARVCNAGTSTVHPVDNK